MNRTTSPRPAYFTRLASFFLTALAVLAFVAQQAQATVYYVSTTGNQLNTGLSWAQAKSDLQAAIHAASGTNNPPDQVWVKYGTYTGNFTATDGVAVYGHFAGTETSITQRQLSNTAYATILDANNSGTVYTIPNSAIKTNTLDGFTVQHGNGNSAGGLSDPSGDTLIVSNAIFTNNNCSSAAGIYAGSAATITNCVFSNDIANGDPGEGGGVYTNGGTVNIVNSIFKNDAAYAVGSGGGLYANGGTVNLGGCSFSGNNAYHGGGLYAAYGGIVNLTGGSFSDNSADTGGGIYADRSTINLSEHCSFSGNSATYPGGAILNNGTATISDCDFSDNSAAQQGGAISVTSASAVTTLARCVFTNNSAGYGGGGFDVQGTASIADCIFQENVPNQLYLYSVGTASMPTVVKDSLIKGTGTTTSDPNGIDVDTGNTGDTAYVTIANNTFTNTNVGVSIASVSGAVKVADNIFYANNGGLNYPGTVPFTSSHNDLYGNTTYNYNGVNQGASDLNVNPMFFDAKNGDYHLSVGSPLLNIGDVGYVVSGDKDLDGHPRLINGKVDLGCYEGAELPNWKAKAVSAAPNGGGRILWNRSDGAAGVWVLGATDAETTIGPTYGPYTGWTAKAISTANDGTSRVLWTNTNGQTGIWTFNAAGTETLIGPTYGPYTGWSAGSLAVAGDGTSRVLWTNVNGEAGVWSFGTNDAETLIGPTYGPISGWGAVAVSAASDGTSRLLWDRSDGAAGLWSLGVNDAVTITGAVYGPYSGWTAKAVGTAGDRTSRVLWTNTNGDAGVWSFGANDAETIIGPTYGPYSGWSAGALGVAYDGTSRVLWNNVSRAAGVWSFNASDVESVIGPTYGPY